MNELNETSMNFPNPLRRNITANVAGTFWQALMGLIFVPLYIKYIGIESYGLIGVFSTLQVIFGLLDVGLGSTLTREMARLSVLPNKEQETRNLVRTLEVLYWSIAVFAGIAVVSLAPMIAQYWIKAGTLSPKTIEQAFLIMGFVMVFQMPVAFYSGGLMGLQKQVLLNVINVCAGTIRGAGAVAVLWLISPTIQAFLLWQFGISMINAFLLALFLWRSLPASEKKCVFQARLVEGIWKFTAGMGGISILAVILTQLDKIILSKMLSLEVFGYYMLASVVAMSLGRLFSPVFFSIYPRFTQLVSLDDQDGLKQLYHKSCQFMSVLILPAAIVIAFFSREIIFLWTQNPIAAEKTHLIVSIMICGTALNGLMNPPYALQLAFGWTRLPLYANLISVVLFIPLVIFVVALSGAVGGALAWLLLNLGYVIFWIPVMHERLLRKEQSRWYLQDLGLPLAASAFIAGLGRICMAEAMSHVMTLLYLTVISLATLGITALATPVTRVWLLEQLLSRNRST
ncbi:MAG: oligosaccharide flippase family protein [Ignavibacteriales bacterium]|nr:oligosaccharide flippase family protein [Ignavibacteriales bacterium]